MGHGSSVGRSVTVNVIGLSNDEAVRKIAGVTKALLEREDEAAASFGFTMRG